jgi:hypothetical protein
MPSSKYHRKQAEILAGLALSTDNATKAEQFKLAALEQLDRAQTVGDTEASPLMPPTGRYDLQRLGPSKWPERKSPPL